MFMNLPRNPSGAFDAANGLGGGNADKVKTMRIDIENALGELDLDEKQIGKILETLDKHASFDKLDDTDPNAERARALAGEDDEDNAESVEKVLAFLKSRGLDDESLEQCRKLLAGTAAAGDDDLVDSSGLPKKTAMDRLPPRLRVAAMDRLSDRHARAEKSFLRRFPEARRIG
jgi:hypothetical protein